MGKIRLDVFLHEKGYFPSREKAKAAIMAGEVFIQGKRIDKAGTAIEEDTCEVEIFSHRQNMWGAAAINSKRPCKSSILIQQTKYFWISAPPRAVLPIACCNKAQKACHRRGIRTARLCPAY